MAKSITAQAKNIRGSARKTRSVAYTVRGMNAMQALNTLKYMNRKAAGQVYKVVNSAVANAVHNENLAPENLIISDIRVNDAPMLKRFRAVSKGRARTILKRNSHIIVTVSVPGADVTKPAKTEVKEAKVEVAEVKAEPKAKTTKAKAAKAPAKAATKTKTTSKSKK